MVITSPGIGTFFSHSRSENLHSMKVAFDPDTGLSEDRESIKRDLSDMAGMFADDATLEDMISADDRLVYEFHDLELEEKDSEIAFGTSIVYPGKVGNEYFMTKGHFHTILNTAEVYYCLKGHGIMLMENPEGEWEVQEMTPGTAVYVPGRYAHRSINTSSDEKLITFFAFRADAGHDYGTIETKGFRKLVVEKNGKAEIIDNPKWAEKL